MGALGAASKTSGGEVRRIGSEIAPPSASNRLPQFKRIVPDRSTASDAYVSWRPCPVCAGERHRPVLDYRNFQFYTDAEVSKQATIREVQCLDCFAVFMNPVFNTLGFATLLAEAGGSYGSTPGRYGEQTAWLLEQGLLKPQTTLLDIGCFDGTFVSKLPEGIRGIGVDIDRQAIRRAQSAFGASGTRRFICADFEAVEVDEAIDVITMFHVFEHLPRPVEVLKRLAHLATAETRLVIEVPVFEHVDYGDICGFLSVLHLTHFSTSSLRNVLRAGGWELVGSHKMPGYNGLRIVAALASRPDNVAPEQDDLGLLWHYMSRWYGAVAEVEMRLKQVTAPYCVIRGGGAHTEYLFQLTSLFASERSFLLVEADKTKQGKFWRGIPIVGPDHLPRLDWGNTQMVLSSYSHHDAMGREARAMGVPEAAIVALYDKIHRC